MKKESPCSRFTRARRTKGRVSYRGRVGESKATAGEHISAMEALAGGPVAYPSESRKEVMGRKKQLLPPLDARLGGLSTFPSPSLRVSKTRRGGTGGSLPKGGRPAES